MENKAKVGDVVRMIGGTAGQRFIVRHVAFNPVIGDDLLTLSRHDRTDRHVGVFFFAPSEQTKPAGVIGPYVAPLCR